ncbi:SUMF1/EgtB/PvdO family nonheme iron enzyme [bacterium]|nr:SUMF1/EgtB/PvdO family nonheme iron enzyme [bacterium]
MNLKKILLLLIISSSIQISWIQPDKEFKQLSLKVIPDHDFYIDETEITNVNYREYLAYLKKKGRMEEYKAAYPDTTVWHNDLAYNEPYARYYLTHPAYSNYPVVGVSLEQARKYCEWRTYVVNKTLRMRGSNVDSVVFRLPTEKEWREAYIGTQLNQVLYPWGYDELRMKGSKKRDDGLFRANIRTGNGVFAHLNDEGFITLPVGSYWPNSIGLYNMVGNVSEWVEEGKLMGSNWNDGAYRGSYDYEPAVEDSGFIASYAGFRCVMEMVKITDIKKKEHKLNKRFFKKYFISLYEDSMGQTSAAQYECTNELFQYYLKATNKSNPIQDQNWAQYTPYLKYQQHSTSDEFRHHPVVNVSYEDAVHFCEWLTGVYREVIDDPNAVIKLPTEKEWLYAARQKRQNVMYPWGGPCTRNSKGAFIANFCPDLEEFLIRDSSGKWVYVYPENEMERRRKADGTEFTAPVDSYYPNHIDIYNIAGNAAEMLETKGTTKGGSWNSPELYLQNNISQTYDEPRADVGFRVFLITS